MIKRKLRAAWVEPRVADAPVRVWRDWALALPVIPVGVVEAILRPDLIWRWISLAVLVPLAIGLFWRRTYPFAVVLAVFGVVGTLNVYSILAGVVWEGLNSFVPVLVLVYALGRWGSGREIILGMGFALTTSVIDYVDDDPVLIGEVLGGFLILGFVMEIGIIVRTQVQSRAQMVDQARSAERELLARELHDTVAHHVSAIAIQAQAGRVQAVNNADAANEALAIIEEEASRTLVEMRAMVGTLRESDQPELAPQRGLADLPSLAAVNGGLLPVDVELNGDLDQLRPAVDAAVFRLAQESVTNAVRHARNASRVAVRVYGNDDSVQLIIVDDGDPTPGADAERDSGFGLVGMAERAKLLGGSLVAGPRPGRGWMVDATLPRNGGAR